MTTAFSWALSPSLPPSLPEIGLADLGSRWQATQAELQRSASFALRHAPADHAPWRIPLWHHPVSSLPDTSPVWATFTSRRKAP